MNPCEFVKSTQALKGFPCRGTGHKSTPTISKFVSLAGQLGGTARVIFLSRYNHIYSTTPYICILAREDQHTYIEFVLGKSWGCSLISQCSFPIQCTRNHDLLHRIRMLGILKHVVPQKFWKIGLVEPCYMSVGCIFSARTATSVAAPS